jgi:glycogen synthase
MRHLILCREFPPAPMPSGGIGTYVAHISKLLASAGETVHVVGQLWPGAPKELEKSYDGRLVVHRIPVGKKDSLKLCHSVSMERIKELEGLQVSSFPPQSFSWQACHLIESLVENENIDIIEAQEYEAPLYYFQLRRALGLGPKKHPPCFVHLHSPTQIINQYNDGDSYHPYFLTAGRLEANSIASADALLCPSRYLARQAEAYFGLPKKAIEVIPLPIGDNKILERDQVTWEKGSICYVGRLERRKGVLEWIDAAVTIAPFYPDVNFDFIGANCLSTERVSGKQMIESRIPQNLKNRFRFWGAQDRLELNKFLLNARMAVVPSRWENFPNTCVEAMSSGLPVIASPEGGMSEMIVDGKNGWLASSADSPALAETLKRAIETAPDEIARMGQNAARDIRIICDNQEIVKRHLEFRARLVSRGAGRSLHLPENLPWAKKTDNWATPRRYSEKKHDPRIAVVVSCLHTSYGLDRCLKSIEGQTRKPLKVIVMTDEWTNQEAKKYFRSSEKKNWQIIQIENGTQKKAKNSGVAAVLDLGINPLAFVFLSSEDEIMGRFLESIASVFLHCPRVGLVSCWIEDPRIKKVVNTVPNPSFPFQWLSNELVSFSAIRTEALIETEGFRSFPYPEYETWDLFNAVMAAGWTAVTLPAVLGKDQTPYKYGLSLYNSRPHGRMCGEILGRFPDLVARDSDELLLLAISSGTYVMNAEMVHMRNRLDLVEKHLRYLGYLRNPKAVLRKSLYKMKNLLKQKLPLRLFSVISEIKNLKKKVNNFE